MYTTTVYIVWDFQAPVVRAAGPGRSPSSIYWVTDILTGSSGSVDGERGWAESFTPFVETIRSTTTYTVHSMSKRQNTEWPDVFRLSIHVEHGRLGMDPPASDFRILDTNAKWGAHLLSTCSTRFPSHGMSVQQ